MKNAAPELRILSAARDLFFKHGFEKVSTDMLAREASVSKATIYRHYKNMADILEKVTETEAAKVRAATPPPINTSEDLRLALTQYGRNLLTFLNVPEHLQFACLMHEEARHNPGIGRTFYKAAFIQGQGDVGALLARAQDKGILRDDFDPLEIAEDLIALFEGFGMIRAQLGVSERPFDDIERRVDRAVITIMTAYALNLGACGAQR